MNLFADKLPRKFTQCLVQQFCDRVIVMKDGQAVESGTPDEVIWHPKDSYTKMLVDSVF